MLSNARFLTVAFVVSAVISLAWQFHAAQRGAMNSGTADQAAVSDEAGSAVSAPQPRDAASQASARHSRVTASGNTDPTNNQRSEEESNAAVPTPEERYIYEYDEEWVGDLYTRLHSPEPLPIDEPDALPIISGRVLTPNGRPVAGIEVIAEFRDYFKGKANSAKPMTPRSRKTRTNADGFYAFEGLAEGIYMVGTGETSQYAVARREVHTGVKYADLVLDPQRYAIIRGAVTDPMGSELAKVRVMPLVKGLPSGTTTDSNGEFSIGIAVGKEVRRVLLRFQLEGFREQRYELTSLDTAVTDDVQIAVTMEPVYEFTTVSGSVKGADDGTPIVGDYVRLYSPSLKQSYKAEIDAAGEFMFANVEIANDYRLWVRPSGPYRDFGEDNFAATPGSVRKDIELEPLDRSRRLSGRIIDQDGRPVPNYTLTLRSVAATGQRLPVTSDAYGRYEIENVPEGELILESQTMPYHKISGLRLDSDRTDHEVDLVINLGRHKLLGRVVDEAGNPVAAPSIFITASQTNANGMQSYLKSTTSADARGRFLFTDLASGNHLITVFAAGYEQVRAQLDVGNQRELVIELAKKTS